jgi:hypothetical protein
MNVSLLLNYLKLLSVPSGLFGYFRFNRVPFFIPLIAVFFTAGCGLQVNLDRQVPFSVTIIPGQIYEGGQAQIELEVIGNFQNAQKVDWRILANENDMASQSEFVSINGQLSVPPSSSSTFL